MTMDNIPSWQVDARLADECAKLKREVRYWRHVTEMAVLITAFAVGCTVALSVVWMVAMKGGTI